VKNKNAADTATITLYSVISVTYVYIYTFGTSCYCRRRSWKLLWWEGRRGPRKWVTVVSLCIAAFSSNHLYIHNIYSFLFYITSRKLLNHWSSNRNASNTPYVRDIPMRAGEGYKKEEIADDGAVA